MSSLKVLHINTYDRGGAAIACIRQHLALLESGVTSFLLTLNKTRTDIPNHLYYFDFVKSPPAGLFTRIKRRLKNELYKAEYERQQQQAHNIALLQAEASEVTDCFSLVTTPYRIDSVPGLEEYDIINLHWTAFFLDWDSFFFVSQNKKVVWTLHDMNPFTGGYHYAAGYEGYKNDDSDPPFLKNTFNPAFAKEQLYEKKKIIFNSKVQIKIVAPSRWLYNCSKQSALFNRFEHFHFPYSLNVTTFKRLNRTFCRQVLNLPSDKKIILFVSDKITNQRKGFSILTNALSLAKDNSYVLCCIGEKNKTDNDEATMLYLGNVFDERVMALAYNAADVFVLPSKEDNLPNVVLESLCCGTPVAGFCIGGMPDMVINGINGMLSEEISSAKLWNAIQAVLNHTEQYNNEVISSAAAIKYAPQVQAQAYSKLYESF